MSRFDDAAQQVRDRQRRADKRDVGVPRIYTTTDDEREAREIAERLWYDQHRKAIVVEVRRMPDPPRTANRYAVLVESR